MTVRAYSVANGERDDVVKQLVQDGVHETAANLATDLVPIAFGWALLKKMGFTSFPSVFELTEADETVNVADSHVFTAALTEAVAVMTHGYTDIFSKRVVSMLIAESPEVDAVNQALAADPNLDLSGATLSSKLSGYTAQEFHEHA